MSAPPLPQPRPHDPKAERALIGGVLRDPPVLAEVRRSIGVGSFYADAHQSIWRAVVKLADTGKPVDLVMIHDELIAANALANVGGASYLADLLGEVPTGAHATYHASIVRDYALRRDLIDAGTELVRDAHSRSMPADELVADLERKLFALSMRTTTNDVHHIGDVVRELLSDIEARIGSGSTLAGLSTGYVDLDNTLSGLKPGELIVVGARPSVGKTAFAVNILDNVARSGIPTLMASLEQRRKEIAGRLLAMASGVPMHKFSRGSRIEPMDAEALAREAGNDRLAGCPIYLDDAPDQSAAHVLAASRRAVAKLGAALVVVDYLQLMRPESSTENRTQQVGTMARRMKLMARECDVPVILLAQLNRDNERERRCPRLSDLRDSGEIEQHADVVLFLHREPDLNANDAVWPIDVVVAKQRNGPVGTVRLSYRRPVTRFENAAVGY